jgi:hypothetical protein
MNEGNQTNVIGKQYEAEITMSNVRSTGLLIINQDGLILRTGNQELSILYSSIESSIITLEKEVKLTLNNGAVIVLSICDNEILLNVINTKKSNSSSDVNQINSVPNNENVNTAEKNQTVESRKGVCVIYGAFSESSSIKVYNNGVLIARIGSGAKFVYNVTQDTLLTFKFRLFKKEELEVRANENVMVKVGIDWLKSKVATEVSTINDTDLERMIKEEPSVSNNNKKTFTFGKLIVSGIIIYVIYNMFFAPMTDAKICRRIQSSVAKYFKDPSSVKINECRVIKKENNLWTITGTASGTNGFGGVASHSYSAVVRVDGHSYEIKGVMVG